MKTSFKSIICIVCVGSLAFTSCGDSSNDKSPEEQLVDIPAESDVAMSDEDIDQIIKSIPSPLEITSIIKATGLDYDKTLLNKTSNSGDYLNTFKKAVNLGIYGADLGYINLYEKTYASMDYLNVIREISTELKLGQFFDFETLKRLATSNDKLDSIIHISTTSFEKMNNHLAKQKRANVSALMLIGGWVESLHLASAVAKQANNAELKERVAEQKVSMEQLMKLMEAFKGEPLFETLVNDMNKLNDLFGAVNIVYTEGEPIEKEVDGMLVVESTSESKIEFTEEQFNALDDQISKIREGLTSK